MHRNQGIVLKTYAPKKCKVSLLDKNLGKIEAMTPRVSFFGTLGPGMVITYFVGERPGSMHELNGVELYDVPLALARYDIYFFHQVLELCYYFLPLNLAAENMYELLLFLLESHEKVGSAIQRKLFLLRFFLYLGIYPEEDFMLEEAWHQLLYEPIDIMLEKTVIISENKLELWLLACIQAHPQKVQFMTLLKGM